jgi:uncharacterized protein DUF5407
MNNPEDREEYGRRELLRRGLIAGGRLAALGVALSSLKPGTAAAAPGSTPPGVSLALAGQWPWGATVNPALPYYLSPDPGAFGSGGSSSGFSVPPISSALGVPPPGARTGIRAPLLVVPLLVSVDLGHPPALHPPFSVVVVATGDGLIAGTDTVQFSVPFLKMGHGGRVPTREWLAIFPVTLGPGSIYMEATIQAAVSAPVSSAGSTFTLVRDFSLAPVATQALTPSDQTSLVGSIATQSQVGFDVGSLFALLNNATATAKAQFQVMEIAKSKIAIGDMFGMQMVANQLDQAGEMSVSVISAVNDAIQSMARNIKG